jgi:hypothetical protein
MYLLAKCKNIETCDPLWGNFFTMKEGPTFIACDSYLAQHHLLKDCSFFLNCFGYYQLTINIKFIYGSPVIFHWSVCLYASTILFWICFFSLIWFFFWDRVLPCSCILASDLPTFCSHLQILGLQVCTNMPSKRVYFSHLFQRRSWLSGSLCDMNGRI